MIYLKEEKFFAYCHWLNSQTGKMQGGTQKRVYERHIQLLVSNYSFNKTTTKLIRITNDDTKVEEYKRMVSNITLIPGPRGSLYLSGDHPFQPPNQVRGDPPVPRCTKPRRVLK